MSIRRLVSILDQRTTVRAGDLYELGIHPQELSRACQRGVLQKVGRGLYARRDLQTDFSHQILLACKRAPNGIVCLKSALQYHGLAKVSSPSIWMAIDFKAKKTHHERSELAVCTVF
jgi:predicted transcriptional regulator of viral defense system